MSDDSRRKCDDTCQYICWFLFSVSVLIGLCFLLIWARCISREAKVRLYELSFLARWKLPIPGLRLCRLCRELKRGSGHVRLQHYDSFQDLEKSGQQECWCCSIITEQFTRSIEDHDIPPITSDPTDLNVPRLLLWFAEQTWTESGYLDHLRHIDYFEYIFKSRYRICQPDPSSQASFCLIRRWLENCNLQHRCYQGTEVKLPTRLIDVSGEKPYLVDSLHLKGPYIALSHCWGEVQPITTTTSTIKTRLKSIPFETLPKMFQDAVYIAQQLKIKYLWIDSLCIIQDSEEDWAREAAQMGNIYRYAFLTVFALDSKDCHQGILVPRSTESLNGAGTIQRDGNINGPFSRSEQCRHKMDILKASPLCKRGWVLQERLLSPRILYYSAEEIFWECLACTARESEMGFRANQPATYVYQRHDCTNMKNRLILPPGPNPSLPLSPPLDWHIIVVEYTRCQLTKQTDKLPALSGLASTFNTNTGYTYLAGIWKEDFRDGLLWYVEPSEHRKDRKAEFVQRGPSWSWISLDYPILYATTKDGSCWRAPLEQDIKLLDCSVQLLGTHTFGQIANASVTVEAHFQSFGYQYCPRSKRYCIYDKNGVKSENFFLDMIDDDMQSKKSCGGLLVTQRHFQVGDCEVNNPPNFIWSYFLVVVPDTSSEKSWRRIGLGRSLRGDEIFKNCPKVKLHLI